MTPTALSVAGSDPSGGAGIQADLKTFSALGAYGTAVLTALTAQSTRGVDGVHPVPAEFVTRQLHTLLDDVEVHATKLGMLGSADVVRAVAAVLAERLPGPVVCDPVMVATSGHRLIDDDAVAAVRTELLPLADLITPNVPEAAALLDTEPARDVDELHEQARALLALGPRAVLIKGGHLGGPESVDVLASAAGTTETRRPRIDTTATHGTGCTLSSALAALAARAGEPPDWVVLVEPARDYLQRALAGGAALRIGAGHGPVHHFAGIWPA
ncbi:bifunctional hydroxymethylpyrimidine kinase/phosphomethylpyrimidine kinase [Blastococcus sp. MG754426]|uniref:bifunctional hydroxymethylpyrimidine kinase/phosphomethylpyrimidine kinase n=1 Tax=unclassified Blastococcus TaxID=2619396 RepID=UPI001EF0AE5B|nr:MULTISPECIES: bifunctional hydroxymethylpyrimidine kinase/phosphomethylpyrimidine kinase [unclassified Blastococcus]MCF6507876.1 bifunctional hydroxymethylpyrimidine kinase/phosphomethylpyrimidine kinase [Blastococcus sp. MG754426]MCF6512416.1 bifunctional hydroxymethylpyrimidine kinase/phosphomethylpyrimidine kinase [Blastococcus sp. MG754427]MCF6735218.1 bifunctional hydroxymethylpyrimidine kinase/phosphomethylpyrimidine kinase [Blastococcus sp. KM273129]